MFRHVVLLKWKPEATSAQRAEVQAAIERLPSVIGTIRAYSVGTDVDVTDGNYDLAVVADFDDAAGYEVYRDDAEHQRVIRDLIRPILASRAAVQHER